MRRVSNNPTLVVVGIATPLIILMSVGAFLLVDFVLESRSQVDSVLEPMITDTGEDDWSEEAVMRRASETYRAQEGTSQVATDLEARVRELAVELERADGQRQLRSLRGVSE